MSPVSIPGRAAAGEGSPASPTVSGLRATRTSRPSRRTSTVRSPSAALTSAANSVSAFDQGEPGGRFDGGAEQCGRASGLLVAGGGRSREVVTQLRDISADVHDTTVPSRVTSVKAALVVSAGRRPHTWNNVA